MDSITTSINSILKKLIKDFNTLLDCPARFSGEYSEEKVHRFIEYIEYYKRIKCISDVQALRELQYLLIDHASDWWLRRKVNISSWSEALVLLENQYSKKRAGNAVYTEILSHHYDDYESKDDFIDDKIELFYELSELELKEKNKLEIIYALLPKDMQDKIKLATVTTIKELKEQIKLGNLSSVDTSDNAASGSEIILESKADLSETDNSLVNQEQDQIAVVNTSSANSGAIFEKDSIIKVRRTEDLMPQNIKEETCPVQQEEFLPNDAQTSTINNILHSSQENFEIDTDIMNQINNIIDESEMNMSAISNNQGASTVPTQPSTCDTTIDLLGYHVDVSKQSNKSTDQRNETQIKATKKLKKRCTYCRRFNHTKETCLKKARYMEMFPERFMQTQVGINDNISQGEISNVTAESLPTNISKSSISAPNTPLTERLLTIPILLNQLATTSMSVTDTLPIVTSSTVLSNAAEKCINPVLTTKLIAPINGKTPNKALASKLRSMNKPSPKCHQCGTLGFYKSICPNCSPIYNNNNHNQYSKKS